MKKLLSALFLVALCSSVAMATVPVAEYCSVTPLLGPIGSQVAFLAPGNLSGTTITISVHNGSDVPIDGATVVVSFNSEIGVCTTATHTAVTAGGGLCTISLRGGGCLSNVLGGCSITANGVEIKNLKWVRSPDNNNHTLSQPDGAVSVADLTYFGDEFKGVVAAECHDYDNNTICNVTDLTYFGDAFKGAMVCTLP